MMYYLLKPNGEGGKSYTECIALLQAYGEQYQKAMQELTSTQKISYENYPLVFDKGENSVVLSKMHRNILAQKPFDISDYRQSLIKALTKKIKWTEERLKEKEYKSYSRHLQNKYAMQAFHWFLPNDYKLKPAEINQLSIYNYIKDSRKANKLTQEDHHFLILEIEYKLKQATPEAYKVLKKNTDFEQYYINILTLLKETLTQVKKDITRYTKEELHELAGKLKVSLPGISESKTGKNRLQELCDTILAKPILIRNGLFYEQFDKKKRKSIAQQIRQNAFLNKPLIQTHYKLQHQTDYILTESMRNVFPEELNKAIGEDIRLLLMEYLDTTEKDELFTKTQKLAVKSLKEKVDAPLLNKFGKLEKIYSKLCAYASAYYAILQVIETGYDDALKVCQNKAEKDEIERTEFMKAIVDELIEKIAPNVLKTMVKEEIYRKYIARACNHYRKLKDIQTYDALLVLMFFSYRKEDINSVFNHKINKDIGNIADFHQNEYLLHTQNTTGKDIKIQYKHLDDLSTNWDKEQLTNIFKNKKYYSDEKWHKIKYPKGEEDTESHVSNKKVLNQILYKVWEESYWYIRNFLKAEKKIIEDGDINELLKQSKKGKKDFFGYERIEPAVLLSKTNLSEAEIKDYIKLRGDAFHAGIPKDKKYSEEQITFCEKVDITEEKWVSKNPNEKKEQDEKNEPKQE